MQITLGFVIILGYLISDNNREVAALQAGRQQLDSQLDHVEAETASWRDAYAEVLRTPQGAAVQERDTALEELQLQRLLRAWDRVRDQRPLRERLRATRAGTAEIELAGDALSLPRGPLFEALQSESQALFPPAIGALREETVPGFVEQVFQQVAAEQRPDDVPLTRPASPDERPFDPQVVTTRNIEVLEDVIRENLLEERSWLVDAQFRLVRDVMEARIEWLARHADAFHPADGEQEQLAVVIAELAERMHLLDEVRLALTRPEEAVRR